MFSKIKLLFRVRKSIFIQKDDFILAFTDQGCAKHYYVLGSGLCTGLHLEQDSVPNPAEVMLWAKERKIR